MLKQAKETHRLTRADWAMENFVFAWWKNDGVSLHIQWKCQLFSYFIAGACISISNPRDALRKPTQAQCRQFKLQPHAKGPKEDREKEKKELQPKSKKAKEWNGKKTPTDYFSNNLFCTNKQFACFAVAYTQLNSLTVCRIWFTITQFEAQQNLTNISMNIASKWRQWNQYRIVEHSYKFLESIKYDENTSTQVFEVLDRFQFGSRCILEQ